jgi:hypothetical protein
MSACATFDVRASLVVSRAQIRSISNAASSSNHRAARLVAEVVREMASA